MKARNATAAVLAAALALLMALVLFLTLFAVVADEQAGPGGVVCTPASGSSSPKEVSGWRGQQLINAAQIVAAAGELHLPQRAAVIGVATAMGESSLRVLDHGDSYGPDSRGLFQQRDNWGSREDRMDPKTSAKLFYKAMLKEVPDWQSRSLTDVAHTTQRNRYPDAYAKFQRPAELVVAAVKGIKCRDTGGGTAHGTNTATKVALAQVGKPYQWGADGPDAYDCSGLTMYAWGKAGVQLPRTSTAQYSAGAHVSRDQLAPGDLLFFSGNGSPSGIHHVGMYLGDDQMVHAPSTGQDVQVEKDLWRNSYYAGQYVGATRPGTKSSAQ